MELPRKSLSAARTQAYLFLHRTGRSPLEEYIRTITVKKEIARLHALIEKLIANQGRLPFPYAKKIRGHLWELRSSPGYRIFYVLLPGPEILLLGGYMKKRDRIEAHVLKRVWNMYQEYLASGNRKPYHSFNPLPPYHP